MIDLLVQVVDGGLGPLGVRGPVRHVQADGAIGVTVARAAREAQGREVPLVDLGKKASRRSVSQSGNQGRGPTEVSRVSLDNSGLGFHCLENRCGMNRKL